MSVDVMKARIMTVMRNLPPLPAVTRQLLAVMRDENSSADDVTKVLSSDQALAGKVLKLVNSSFYGVPTEVTKISRAVVLLGFTGVRNLALGFGSMDALSKLTGKMDMTEFWSHAMANAAGAQSLAPFVKRRTDPEEAFIAGLMHDIGAYVLAAAVPDEYMKIMAEPAEDRLSLESEKMGLNHAQVGQALLKFWELPEAFSNAARYHHDMTVATSGDQPLTTLVALADVMACVHGGAFENPVTEAQLGKLMSTEGVGADQMCQAMQGMDQKIEEMEVFMQIAGTAAGGKDVNPLAFLKSVALVTTDDDRVQWLTAVMSNFEVGVFPAQAFFNQEAGSQEVGLAMVDPQCLTAQQVDQLVPFLESQPARVVVLAEPDTGVPAALQSYPQLGFVFSRSQLAEACRLQPA
jgi:HD-like signal output (HDOD) protein|nr:HDOD domain-containing protein [Candidatus Krumholzibacteria bacterium]